MIEEKKHWEMSVHTIERAHIIRYERYYQTTVVCMPNITFYIATKVFNDEIGFKGDGFSIWGSGRVRFYEHEVQHVQHGSYDKAITSQILKRELNRIRMLQDERKSRMS